VVDVVWPMMRGHVYKIWFDPDDPSKPAPITKYVVILQGQSFFKNKRRVSAVLATSQPSPRPTPGWEVRVPAGTVDFWPKETRICCGDVWSFLVVDEIRRRGGRPVGALPDHVLTEVDVAVAVSLGIV
jgi:mRNA-degrading endonuclease toxin of MazEF toxin-antitoxin module